MSENWYSVEEIKRWTEADSRGFGEHAEWLAAQLNSAFEKGRQVGDEQLRRAIRELNADQHAWQDRPCPTCQFITKIVGSPFGCVERLRDRQRRATT